MPENPPLVRWSADTAWKWYDAQPYLIGANFIPGTAVNQLEMWQAETFDPVTIDRELSWGAKLGMNVMRVYLNDLLWTHDAKGFADRIDQYLTIADRHGIRTIFVLLDDCWNDQPALGPQPAPKPFQHNTAWVQSPGKRVVNDPTAWPSVEQYVKQILTRFRADRRILAWDLYNEPGNDTFGAELARGEKQGKKSLPLLTAAFTWARSIDNLTQPLSVAPWNFSPDYAELNEFSLAKSDIITFHNYGPPQDLGDRIRDLRKLARPMICTEYMCRGLGSTFEYCLPILAKNRVGAINWGLVSGKTQTIYPWNWNIGKGNPEVWFHDIFNPDGTMLYPHETRVFQNVRS